MRVVLTFDWSDEDRAALVEYLRMAQDEKGLPKLARRSDIEAFIRNAIGNQWLHVGDTMAAHEDWKRKQNSE